MAKGLTTQEYVEAGGRACPKCKRSNLGISNLELSGDGYVKRKKRCKSCGHRWNDVFVLAGFDDE